MKLTGGIDAYSCDFKRFESDTPPNGRKVKFLNENGHDWQLEEARKIFKEGQILEVEEIEVGGWSSKVKFADCDGWFNTVMFEDVEV